MTIRRKKTTRGFTLVELMVVVVILGTLIALVGPNVWRALFESNYQAARTQMKSFGNAIQQYKMSNKKLPDSLEDLTQTDGPNPYPYMERIPLDPWDNEYEYRVIDRNTYEIRSMGEDGLPDTDDDVRWPEQDES